MHSRKRSFTPQDVRIVLQLLGESIAPRILTLYTDGDNRGAYGRTRMCGGCGATLREGGVVRLPLTPGEERLVDDDVKYRCLNCHRRSVAYQLTSTELTKHRSLAKLPAARKSHTVPIAIGGEDDGQVAAG